MTERHKNMKVSEAAAITGGLFHPSKMPGPAYSLPAQDCKIGSILAKQPGTTCHNCYALKGFYQFPKVHEALVRRLESLSNPLWVEAMVTQILSSKTKYFRWHDSGDLQSVQHLRNIILVCLATPKVKHWLPTREYKIVQDYVPQYGMFPPNLVVRLSAHRVDAAPPTGYGLPTSTVHTHGSSHHGEECKAYTRDNKCGNCRSCWNPNVTNVSYLKH
jgi:hypothetical protein